MNARQLRVARSVNDALVALRSPRSLRRGDWNAFVSTGHRVGPKEARLTIVEFGDFQCPACGAFFKTVEKLRAAHPSDIAIIFHHLPLPYHQFAYASARAAECAAAQGRFSQMYDVLYRKQDSLGILRFGEFAIRAGVGDTATFRMCMADDKLLPVVEADIAAAKKLGVRGTPGVLVNGMFFSISPQEKRLEAMLKLASSQ